MATWIRNNHSGFVELTRPPRPPKPAKAHQRASLSHGGGVASLSRTVGIHWSGLGDLVRSRKGSPAASCEGRKSHAEMNSEMVQIAKGLRPA
jgi:hypothetical protein